MLADLVEARGELLRRCFRAPAFPSDLQCAVGGELRRARAARRARRRLSLSCFRLRRSPTTGFSSGSRARRSRTAVAPKPSAVAGRICRWSAGRAESGGAMARGGEELDRAVSAASAGRRARVGCDGGGRRRGRRPVGVGRLSRQRLSRRVGILRCRRWRAPGGQRCPEQQRLRTAAQISTSSVIHVDLLARRLRRLAPARDPAGRRVPARRGRGGRSAASARSASSTSALRRPRGDSSTSRYLSRHSCSVGINLSREHASTRSHRRAARPVGVWCIRIRARWRDRSAAS